MRTAVILRFIICLTGFMGISGCSEPTSSNGLILSAEQAKTQMLQPIDPRLNWAIENNNYQVQTFNADWQVIQTETIELYSQARQVYLFAKGYDVTQEQKYLQATIASAEFMLRYMFDATTSNWYSSVNRQDTTIHFAPKEYGTSFALFAMAHVYRITEDKRYLDTALKTWMLGDISIGLTLAKQAKANNLEQDQHTATWSINPLMHLFEALLALYDVSSSQVIWQDIEAIANFVTNDLLQPQGYLAEYYHHTNTPLPLSEGGYVELGHQIEWAYLLHTAVDKGLSGEFRNTANILYKYAMKTGWNEQSGSLAGRSDYEGKITQPEPVWWAQAELLRLSAYLKNNNYDGQRNARRFSHSMAFVVNEYVDQVQGGWMNNKQSKRTRNSLNKVLGYHAVAAYDELNDF